MQLDVLLSIFDQLSTPVRSAIDDLRSYGVQNCVETFGIEEDVSKAKDFLTICNEAGVTGSYELLSDIEMYYQFVSACGETDQAFHDATSFIAVAEEEGVESAIKMFPLPSRFIKFSNYIGLSDEAVAKIKSILPD